MNKFDGSGRTFASLFRKTKIPGEPTFVPRPQTPTTIRNHVPSTPRSQTPAIPEPVVTEKLNSIEVVSKDIGQQKRSRSERFC